MIVLELFAGLRSISKAFEKRGHKTYSVEWNKDFENIDLYDDVNNLTPKKIIKLCGGIPDVIWASPDCTTYSVAGIYRHRKLNKETGNLDPISEYAKFCDKTNKHLLDLIQELKPTDIWTNYPNPNFKKPCKNGDSCHVSAPRGSRTGTQGVKDVKDRSVIPSELCDYIVKICEKENEKMSSMQNYIDDIEEEIENMKEKERIRLYEQNMEEKEYGN